MCGALQVQNDAIYLPDNVFGFWMAHSEPEIRLAGMFLSIYSVSITKAISGGILQSLKRNLDHLHTDTDTNFRREVHAHTQKLFDRLRASTATLSKGKSKSAASTEQRIAISRNKFPLKILRSPSSQFDPLSDALAFVVWYSQLLEWQMRPTASYQRCITALRCLSIELRSGLDPEVQHSLLSKSAQGQLNWAHSLKISTPKVIRVLFDQILDPFDDIRDAAVSTLRLCLDTLPAVQRNVVLATIPRFLARAEEMMLQTGRADQADGVARAHGLAFSLASDTQTAPEGIIFPSKFEMFERLTDELNETLTMAQTNLVEAVEGRPIHGMYASLRYIIDQVDFYPVLLAASKERFTEWKDVHTTILQTLEPLWSNVYPNLCADAPEGHVPDGMEEENTVDTKEISSYSWRGLKEAR